MIIIIIIINLIYYYNNYFLGLRIGIWHYDEKVLILSKMANFNDLRKSEEDNNFEKKRGKGIGKGKGKGNGNGKANSVFVSII